MITEQQINDMEIAAQHCDDYSQHKREMREVARLRAQLNQGRATTQTRNRPSQRRPTGRRTAASVSDALDMMENKA